MHCTAAAVAFHCCRVHAMPHLWCFVGWCCCKVVPRSGMLGSEQDGCTPRVLSFHIMESPTLPPAFSVGYCQGAQGTRHGPGPAVTHTGLLRVVCFPQGAQGAAEEDGVGRGRGG